VPLLLARSADFSKFTDKDPIGCDMERNHSDDSKNRAAMSSEVRRGPDGPHGHLGHRHAFRASAVLRDGAPSASGVDAPPGEVIPRGVPHDIEGSLTM
jgi:hypothetical protein